MTMEVRGTTEVVGWVLGFGGDARVMEPKGLRDAVAGELRRATERYRPGRG